jgi:hypothetical protein
MPMADPFVIGLTQFISDTAHLRVQYLRPSEALPIIKRHLRAKFPM